MQMFEREYDCVGGEGGGCNSRLMWWRFLNFLIRVNLL